MHRPAITAFTMARLRTGSREAKKSMRLSMSTNPPISFKTKSSRVETSASGGRKNIRMMRGLLAKIMKRPPTAVSAENTLKTIRKGRYGGRDMGANLPSFDRWIVGTLDQKIIRLGLDGPATVEERARSFPILCPASAASDRPLARRRIDNERRG